MSLRRLFSAAVFESITVDVAPNGVALIQFNRPEKRNCLNEKMWNEFQTAVEKCGADGNVRCVVVSGHGEAFCAGIDLELLKSLQPRTSQGDHARQSLALFEKIQKYQRAFTVIEEIPQPVISAVHGPCIGAGVDLITAADVRLCSSSAVFSVREVAVGLCADVGTLQRLPKVVGGQSWVRDVCLTGRNFGAEEARKEGLVSGVFNTKEELLAAATKMAGTIAAHSPLAVAGTKRSLVYSRDRSVTEGLKDVALWNASMLRGDDIANSMSKTPTYANLK